MYRNTLFLKIKIVFSYDQVISNREQGPDHSQEYHGNRRLCQQDARSSSTRCSSKMVRLHHRAVHSLPVLHLLHENPRVIGGLPGHLVCGVHLLLLRPRLHLCGHHRSGALPLEAGRPTLPSNQHPDSSISQKTQDS